MKILATPDGWGRNRREHMDLKTRWQQKVRWAWLSARRLARQIKLLTLVAAVSAPLVGSRMPSTLERVQATGKLTIISRNGPTTYYEGANGYTGFEYTLAQAFAKRLGVQLEIVRSEERRVGKEW